MDAMRLVWSNPELVESILNQVSVADLGACAEVNSTWNKEAVKILNQKAIVNLDFDDDKVSTYADMIRKGGRCHGQIALDCLGKTYRIGLLQFRHEVTDEEFETLQSAIEIFGASNIKRLMVKFEVGYAARSPEDFQPIFIAAQNVEFLKIGNRLKDGFPTSSIPSCFPEGISFNCLKDLSVDLASPDHNEKRNVIAKIVQMSPNLTTLRGDDDVVGIFLDEMEKTPGRLEKIFKICTVPLDHVPQRLMNIEFPNLKILDLEIHSGNVDKVVPILEKYKDALLELRLSLRYEGGRELTFPKSMDKLHKIYVQFRFPGCPESAAKYTLLKFPMRPRADAEHDSNVKFYPNLSKFEMAMTGNRDRHVLKNYLEMVFPGPHRNPWIKKGGNPLHRPNSCIAIFASVRSLNLSSQCEDWNDILSDQYTLRKLMYYFPNADFGSAQLVRISFA